MPPANRPHPASLLPSIVHNPLLVHLLRQPVSYDMVAYVAKATTRAIPIEEDAPSPTSAVASALPTPPHTPHGTKFHEQAPPPSPPLISLEDFIVHIIKSSNVQVPTLLTTLILLDRLQSRLPKMAKGGSLSRPPCPTS